MASLDVEAFLAQAEPAANSNRFAMGPFETGITLYKQQVRAINLLYALTEKDRLPANANIAVIGGGASGITAAIASVILGHTVYLFERHPFLCHLQHGCDIRWLHPQRSSHFVSIRE